MGERQRMEQYRSRGFASNVFPQPGQALVCRLFAPVTAQSLLQNFLVASFGLKVFLQTGHDTSDKVSFATARQRLLQ
jgi:hypothetical protein